MGKNTKLSLVAFEFESDAWQSLEVGGFISRLQLQSDELSFQRLNSLGHESIHGRALGL